MKPIEAITKPLLERIEQRDALIAKLKEKLAQQDQAINKLNEELAKKDQAIDKLIIAFADKHPVVNDKYDDLKYRDPNNSAFIKLCPCCDKEVKNLWFAVSCSDCWKEHQTKLNGSTGEYNCRKIFWEIGHNKVRPQKEEDIEIPF